MSPRLETDHDERGDAAEQTQRRGALRGALLAIAVAVLVGGSWWAGHSGKSATQDASAVPEIHPDSAPVKEPPKDPGGMVVPGQDSELLNPNAKRKPEELLPPPEAVKPRPAPPPQVATAPAAPPPAAITTPPTSAPAPTAQPAPAPPPAVASASPAPVPALSKPPAAKAPPAPTRLATAYRLQLGALKSEEAAKIEWQKLQRQNSDVLGKLSLSVSRVELGAKGTYYRIQAGPIADAAQAAQDCAALKSRKIGCILVKP